MVWNSRKRTNYDSKIKMMLDIMLMTSCVRRVPMISVKTVRICIMG